MKLKLLSAVSVGLLACTGINAQSLLRGITKNSIVDAYGAPDKEVLYDLGTHKGEHLHYGEDLFIIIDGHLSGMEILSPDITLQALSPQGMKVGDSAGFVTDGSKYQFKEEHPERGCRVFSCRINHGEELIQIYTREGIIAGISVSGITDRNEFSKEEYKGFFNSGIKPGALAVVRNPDGPAKEEDTPIPNGQTVSASQSDDNLLPEYKDRPDNLQVIVRPKESPLKLVYENKKKTRYVGVYVTFFTCENEDFCDYTIKMEDGSLYRIVPGKTIYKDIKDGFNYQWYRGNAISDINAEFPYALPVAPESKVKFIKDSREKHPSFAVLAETGTPAYAMRGGKVCKTDEDNCILVCHKDGTFAAYMNVDDKSVRPGDSINPGDSIGRCGADKLSISIFHLDKNKVQSGQNDPYSYLVPYFRTAKGIIKLETGSEYTSFIDTDLITKEMDGIQKNDYHKKARK